MPAPNISVAFTFEKNCTHTAEYDFGLGAAINHNSTCNLENLTEDTVTVTLNMGCLLGQTLIVQTLWDAPRNSRGFFTRSEECIEDLPGISPEEPSMWQEYPFSSYNTPVSSGQSPGYYEIWYLRPLADIPAGTQIRFKGSLRVAHCIHVDHDATPYYIAHAESHDHPTGSDPTLYRYTMDRKLGALDVVPTLAVGGFSFERYSETTLINSYEYPLETFSLNDVIPWGHLEGKETNILYYPGGSVQLRSDAEKWTMWPGYILLDDNSGYIPGDLLHFRGTQQLTPWEPGFPGSGGYLVYPWTGSLALFQVGVTNDNGGEIDAALDSFQMTKWVFRVANGDELILTPWKLNAFGVLAEGTDNPVSTGTCPCIKPLKNAEMALGYVRVNESSQSIFRVSRWDGSSERYMQDVARASKGDFCIDKNGRMIVALYDGEWKVCVGTLASGGTAWTFSDAVAMGVSNSMAGVRGSVEAMPDGTYQFTYIAEISGTAVVRILRCKKLSNAGVGTWV